MYKCKVCGKEFELKAENKYLTEGIVGLAAVLFPVRRVVECFDCPHCGCQNSIQERFPEIKQPVEADLPECFKCYDETCNTCKECRLKKTCEEKSEKEETSEKLPNCFGDYDEDEGCEDCEWGSECFQKTYENSLDKRNTESTEDEESNADCILKEHSVSGCDSCVYEGECGEKAEKPKRPNCFGHYLNENCDGDDCEWVLECFVETPK